MAKGKLVLEGVITLCSPLLIGCGSKDHSDVDIIRDGNNRPFIPATSFIGALQHFIKIERRENDLKQFWGFTADGKRLPIQRKKSRVLYVAGTLFAKKILYLKLLFVMA